MQRYRVLDLKSYVPKLHKTYNAKEWDGEHPLRFVN